MNIEEQVIAIVAEIIDEDIQNVTVSSAIGDFPAWDSMGQLAILQRVEETFGVTFKPEEMMEIEDVTDIIKAIESKR